MSHPNLPVLLTLASPRFPQVFPSTLVGILDRYLVRVDAILSQAQLGSCDYSDEHVDCKALATVHDLASEREFCARHFQAVSRG